MKNEHKNLDTVPHSFHRLIGKIVDTLKSNDLEILKDSACCKKGLAGRKAEEGHDLPLFSSEKRSSATRFANVDILMIYRGRVKIIFEIEESSVEPVHVIGKFFTSALSSFYIYGKAAPVPFDDSVLFIQILDTSKIIKAHIKTEQWDIIEQSINRIIPVDRSKINRYKIFYGEPDEFNENGEKKEALISYLNDYLKH